ncbi:DUF6691 family protein [Asaia sp. BMEF1]|uniref:DUF6691 family protein n=1 Tax=Asaia sp. BMEF1 TaxID=3155932 RepID=UPI003F66F1FF
MKLINLVSFFCGTVFSLGLIEGKMIDPAAVLAFLDFAGAWRPALIFVLFGAVIVAYTGVEIQKHQARPWLDESFSMPTMRKIDRRLIIGSMVFGLGWGLVGLCPGPAIAGLLIGNLKTLVFLMALFVGMYGFSFWSRRAG